MKEIPIQNHAASFAKEKGPIIGWSDTLSVLPLKAEILARGKKIMTLRQGSSFDIAQWLKEGDVNLASSSCVSILKHASIEQALPLGVVNRGKTKNTFLGIKGPLCVPCANLDSRYALVKDIFLECLAECPHGGESFSKAFWGKVKLLPNMYDSNQRPRLKMAKPNEASGLLAKLFIAAVFTGSTQEVDAMLSRGAEDDRFGSIEVVVADEAALKKENYPVIIDLGHFWNYVTDRSVVHELWVKRVGHKLNKNVEQLIEDAALSAHVKMRSNPDFYFELLPESGEPLGRSKWLADYWQGVDYALSQRDVESMRWFFSLSTVFLNTWDENYLGKLAKWSERVSESQDLLSVGVDL